MSRLASAIAQLLASDHLLSAQVNCNGSYQSRIQYGSLRHFRHLAASHWTHRLLLNNNGITWSNYHSDTQAIAPFYPINRRFPTCGVALDRVL